MLRLIETLYSYDAWATDCLLDAMDDLTEDEYEGECAGDHGSIRDTFAHLILAEWRYLSWLDGSQSLPEAYDLVLNGDGIPTIVVARRRWNAVKEQAAWFIASLSDPELRLERRGTLADGSEIALPLWTILLHIVNQNAQTRGQILAAMQRGGRLAGAADLFDYARRKQIRGSLAYQ